MRRQLEAAAQEDNPNLWYVVDETDCRNWHFMVVNLPPPYAGGEYIFRLKAPDDFPQSPPEFSFLTPNGVYTPGGKICISIGEFHKTGTGTTGWRAALGMIGFAREVVNGMIANTFKGGIRILDNVPPAAKKGLAKASSEYNQKNCMRLCEQFAEFGESNPEQSAVKLYKMYKAAGRVDTAAVFCGGGGGLAELSNTLGATAVIHGGGNLAELSNALGATWPVFEPWVNFAVIAALSADDFAMDASAQLRNALDEHDMQIRHALVLVLNVSIALESERLGLLEKDASSNTTVAAAFQSLIGVLPGVSGSSSGVAPALEQVLSTVIPASAKGPETYKAISGYLVSFLRTADIDKKNARGRALIGLLEDTLCNGGQVPPMKPQK